MNVNIHSNISGTGKITLAENVLESLGTFPGNVLVLVFVSEGSVLLTSAFSTVVCGNYSAVQFSANALIKPPSQIIPHTHTQMLQTEKSNKTGR